MAPDLTPGEEFLNTLAGEPHAHTPFQEMEVSARVVDAVLGEDHGVISTLLDPEDYARFALETNQGALYHNALWKAGRVYGRTSEGREAYVDGFVKSEADIPRIEPWDWEQSVRRVERLAAAAREHGLAVSVALTPPYKLAKAAIGYEDFLVDLHTAPDFVLALVDWFEEATAEPNARILDAGADALLIPGDLCTGSGPFISPEMTAKFWTPTIRRLAELAAGKGLRVIMHMDGDFSRIADDLLELPIDVLHPFEPCGDLDIFAFHEKYGDRVTVWGNLDLAGVLTRGTPEEVAADARRHIERLSTGGRYVLGSSHEISPDVPVENFLAMVDVSRRAG